MILCHNCQTIGWNNIKLVSKYHISVAITITCTTKISHTIHHRIKEILCICWIWFRMNTTKIIHWHSIQNPLFLCTKSVYKNFLCSWSSRCIHCIKAEGMPCLKPSTNCIKIEHRFHQIGIIFYWIKIFNLRNIQCFIIRNIK